MQHNNGDDFPIVKTLSEAQVPPIIDQVSANEQYFGYAPLGTKEDSPSWKILKVTTLGTVTTPGYPDGNNRYEYKWSERLTYTYSR